MTTLEVELNEIANLLNEKKWAEAEEPTRRLLRARPSMPVALYALGRAIADHGEDSEAHRLYRQAIDVNRAYVDPYHALAVAHYSAGRIEDAADVYRHWSIVEPDNPVVQHMMAATTGQNVPATCSQGYVQTHFNDFAKNFDEVLIKRVSYKGPEAIASALRQYAPGDGATFDVLDAGCGTGLCGVAIRERCRTLVGVDLAKKMIEEARKRGCYDDLVVSELCLFMESRAAEFDVIVSSDVLVYFGALERVMAAFGSALKPGGLVIYALEALSAEGGEPYHLTASGRYAHRESYLRNVMAASGLKPLAVYQDSLRWENGRPVPFHCVVAAKNCT